MHEQTEMQGLNPVASGQRRPVTAESFRRLTALLKKSQTPLPRIPDLQQITSSEVVSTAEHVLIDVEMPVPVRVQAELAPSEPELPAAQEATESIAVPVPADETAAPALIEAAVVTQELEPQAPETPAAEPPKRRPSILRKKPLDAFSLVPSNETPAKPAEPIIQTPEQEAEVGELARSLLDMMSSSAGGGQPQERALAADTLLRMVPRLPQRAKITLAERLSMMEQPPPFLVAKLINDPDITVSGPLLEECMHIPDEDLLTVVASAPSDKRRMIARRRRISRPVSEALAATHDDSVLLTLARNQGAEISQEAYEELAHEAHGFSDLLAPLCTRQDLPVHFAFELFWLASAQLRRYLLHRFLTDSETLTKILKITLDNQGEEQPAAADPETIKAAIESALTEPQGDFMQFFAEAANVNVATVERVLSDKQGEPLMALLKVVGLPRSQLEEIIGTFNQGTQPLLDPMRDLSEVQSVFDQLSFNKARILLTYWDWATLKSGPYAHAH